MSTATRIKNRADGSLKPQVPDFCPACDATNNPFQLVRRKVPQDFRGETLEVEASALACQSCGFEMAAPGQLENLRLATLDAYRLRHGLLTSAEIVERRTKMGMSQRAFADHIGVGVASLQRWEKGLMVQDKASDNLLRICTKHTMFVVMLDDSSRAMKEKVTVKTMKTFRPKAGGWQAKLRKVKHLSATTVEYTPENDCAYAFCAPA
jgi:putative zinc finger/helix-turn-helix YgiT family protein